MNKKRIDSEKILLRVIEYDDWEDILLYRSLPCVARYQYWEPYTKADALNFVNQCCNTDLDVKDQWIGLTIVQKENGCIIGDCALKIRIDTAEIGCNISPNYQKRGLAQIVIQMLINYCIQCKNINKIFGITDSQNIASIRLMESVGMIKDPLFEEKGKCKGYPYIEHKYVIELLSK